MKIDVVLTEKAFRRFTMFDLLRRRKVWKSPALFAAILGFCAVICFIMNHVDGAAFLGSTLLVVGLGLPVYYFVEFFFSLRKQIIVTGLKRPQKVYSLEFTKDAKGIHVSNEKEKADYAWKDVYHVYRDAYATYLYMTPARAFILPDTSLEDFKGEELWQLIVKYTGKEKCTVL